MTARRFRAGRRIIELTIPMALKTAWILVLILRSEFGSEMHKM